MATKKSKKEHQVKTTGHEWDGIKEFDRPDPFGLRAVFYIMLFFCLGYWLLYPSWPTSATGILNWSSQKQLEDSLADIRAVRAQYQSDFDKSSFDEVMKNSTLLKFAISGGDSAFRNNCAVCHGNGGGGNIGYPNLTAGSWLWGGTIEDIYTTIKYGIRSGHDEARDSQMAAFGKDGLLTKEEIKSLSEYVPKLYEGREKGSYADSLYQDNCASCHGDKGQGGRDFGAPRLNDAIWLYGKEPETIYNVIYNGRAGVMPYWEGKLSDSTIRQLAIYVHQLGGGE